MCPGEGEGGQHGHYGLGFSVCGFRVSVFSRHIVFLGDSAADAGIRTQSPWFPLAWAVVRTKRKTHDINTEDGRRGSVLCKRCLGSLTPFIK